MVAQGVILVVDDDATLVEAVTDRLRTAGYRATAAYDRAEAVIQADALKPALVICDLKMPIFGTGADAYSDFRGNPRLKNVPVIFITGIPLEEAKRVVPFDDPRVRLMHKPIDWVMLEQAIHELIGEHRPLA